MLKKIAMSVLSALLTERFVKALVIFLLKKLAEKSDNKVDDEIVDMIERALAEEKPRKEVP